MIDPVQLADIRESIDGLERRIGGLFFTPIGYRSLDSTVAKLSPLAWQAKVSLGRRELTPEEMAAHRALISEDRALDALQASIKTAYAAVVSLECVINRNKCDPIR